MGHRRKSLIRVSVNVYDNDKKESQSLLNNYINYYTINMKPDSAEYDQLSIKTILEALLDNDLVKNPNALDDIDLIENNENNAKKYSLSYFIWEKLLGKDYNNHFEIETMVEKELLNCGSDYEGLILEVDYDYYHEFKSRQIELNNLLVYGYLIGEDDFYIVPHDLYRAYHEYDNFESFYDEEFIFNFFNRKNDYDKLSRKEKIKKLALNYNHFNTTLSNGQNIEIFDEFQNFLQSTYVRQSPNNKLPLICNVCHKPIRVGEEKIPYIFNISSLDRLGEEYNNNINIPFTDEEIDRGQRDEVKYLNIYHRDKIVVYHNECLCK